MNYDGSHIKKGRKTQRQSKYTCNDRNIKLYQWVFYQNRSTADIIKPQTGLFVFVIWLSLAHIFKCSNFGKWSRVVHLRLFSYLVKQNLWLPINHLSISSISKNHIPIQIENQNYEQPVKGADDVNTLSRIKSRTQNYTPSWHHKTTHHSVVAHPLCAGVVFWGVQSKITNFITNRRGLKILCDK